MQRYMFLLVGILLVSIVSCAGSGEPTYIVVDQYSLGQTKTLYGLPIAQEWLITGTQAQNVYDAVLQLPTTFSLPPCNIVPAPHYSYTLEFYNNGSTTPMATASYSGTGVCGLQLLMLQRGSTIDTMAITPHFTTILEQATGLSQLE
jgi:hypothetical protein